MKLLGTGNSKTVKGEKKGWTTYVMYLSPHKQNSKGKNLCSHASIGCAESCLFTAGRGRMSNIKQARLNKTELFLEDQVFFMSKLIMEITAIQKRHLKLGTNFCIRLNGTSDIPFENVKYQGRNIFELFSKVQFYDYTKNPNRMIKNKLKNYHLTFSRSETNHEECIELMQLDHNVAIVFNDVPKYFNKIEVIDGDEDDLRFLDDTNVIVGLSAKGDAKKDLTGFVI